MTARSVIEQVIAGVVFEEGFAGFRDVGPARNPRVLQLIQVTGGPRRNHC